MNNEQIANYLFLIDNTSTLNQNMVSGAPYITMVKSFIGNILECDPKFNDFYYCFSDENGIPVFINQKSSNFNVRKLHISPYGNYYETIKRGLVEFNKIRVGKVDVNGAFLNLKQKSNKYIIIL